MASNNTIFHFYPSFTQFKELGFHCNVVVFHTPNGFMWNLGNLSKAMWNSTRSLHSTWGRQDRTLDQYVRTKKNIPNIDNLWIDWSTLKEMLQTDWPNDDHRETWWAGQE